MTREFTVLLTEQHYLDANRLHYLGGLKSRKLIWALVRLTALYWTVGIAITYLHNGTLENANWIELSVIGVIAAIVVLAICYAIGYFSLPRRSRKLFAQQKLLHEPVRYEAGDSLLSARTNLTETKLPYEHALKWLENSKYFLVYHTDNSFQILPRQYADDNVLSTIRSGLKAARIPGREL